MIRTRVGVRGSGACHDVVYSGRGVAVSEEGQQPLGEVGGVFLSHPMSGGRDVPSHVCGVSDHLVVDHLSQGALRTDCQYGNAQRRVAVVGCVGDIGVKRAEVLKRRAHVSGLPQLCRVLGDRLLINAALDHLQPIDESVDPGILASRDHPLGQAVAEGKEPEVPQTRTLLP